MVDLSGAGAPIDPAQTRLIGHTDVSVSALALGGSALGGLYSDVDEADAFAAIHSGLAAGLRYIDVAPWYGFGLAEERLGRILSQLPRHSFTLSTKVGRVLVDPPQQAARLMPEGGGSGRDDRFDFSRDGILRSLEESLARLQVDRVDMVYLHDPDDHWDESIATGYPTIAELKAEGVVRAIGVGMNQTAMLSRFVDETDIDVVLCAGRYSLLDRSAADGLLPRCQDRGVSVVIGGVMNSGILGDPFAESPTYDYRPATLEIVNRAQRLAKICERHDAPLAAAALQFPARHPGVASVLTGVRSQAEVEMNARLAALPLPDDLWEELAAEWQKPGAN